MDWQERYEKLICVFDLFLHYGAPKLLHMDLS